MSALERRPLSLVLTLALLGFVVAVVILTRPTEEISPDQSLPERATYEVVDSSSSDFCRRLADVNKANKAFAADVEDRATENALRESATALVAGGMPRLMPEAARRAYYVLVEGIYGTVGLSLEPAQVGAPEWSVPDQDQSFRSFLTDTCGI